MSSSLKAAFAAVIVVLSSCVVGPKYTPPQPPSVQTYTRPAPGAGREAAASAGQSAIVNRAPPRDWWRQLESAELDQVVELALQNNLSLEVARANLARAEELVKVERGARSVHVDVAGGVERTTDGTFILGPEAKTFPTFDAYTVGPSVSYDLDLFGGLRHRVAAAGAAADYEHEQLHAARLRVTGDSLMEALQIASVRAQIAVMQGVLSADEQTLQLVRAARHTGVVSDIDVLQAESQRDQDRTALPPLQQALDAAQDALAVLIGKTPSEWAPPDFVLDRVVLPRELSLVVPSELVHTRPDIRAAEAELREASASVGIATAALYPQVRLTADWAQEGLLSGGAANAWGLIGGVTAPVFHGGALTAQRRAAQDDYQAAFARYQLVVLKSFSQVADTLHALEHDADALDTQQQALASASRSLELTRLGYRVGNANILQILTAQRLQQLAELGKVQARARQLNDAVQLYLAAGGGEE